MRYSIVNCSAEEVQQVGGQNIKEMKNSPVVFADLDDVQAQKLIDAGYSLSTLKNVAPPVYTPAPKAAVPTYTPEDVLTILNVDVVRNMMTPPLYGDGMYIAVIGTGIRATHIDIGGMVVYSKNYTTSPDGDVYNHDTSVASIIHAVAPKAGILDLKVIDGTGNGTSEAVTEAIDDCISMLQSGDPHAPAVINMSFGTADTDDINDPMRIACRAAIAAGIWCIAAAGNNGPLPISITSPAVERYVAAIGSMSVGTGIVSNFSSRGPTFQGLVKPDVLAPGEDLQMAGSTSDTALVAKSGTSFSTPFASGSCVLIREGIIRKAQASFIPGTISYEAAWAAVDEPTFLNNIVPLLCGKPAGEPAGKDNNYGYGIPIMAQVAAVLSRAAPSVAAVGVSSMVGMMMVVMMMGMMMKGMGKMGVKK